MPTFPVYVSEAEFNKFLLMVDSYAVEHGTNRSALTVRALNEYIAKGVRDDNYSSVVVPTVPSGGTDTSGERASTAASAEAPQVGYIR